MNPRHLLLALCLAACSGAQVKPLPAYYSTKTTEHPKYARARYMTGIGVSPTSAEDAANRAKADVAAQISSQIETETSAFERYTTAGGSNADIIVKTRVHADFKRADLIRVVEAEKNGDTFYAFAALDRAQAAQEMSAAMNANLSAFTGAAQTAVQANSDEKTAVFWEASSQASKIRPDLDADFVRRRAIAGRPAPEEESYVKLRNQLLVLREQHLARRVVGVVLKNQGDGHLNDYAVNAVKHIGLRPDTMSCDKRAKNDATDATELEVSPEESCGEGSLGERCEVTVHLTAHACVGDTSGAGTVPMKRGVHPSDRDKARKSAWDKVTPDLIEAAVKEALKSAIQIGE